MSLLRFERFDAEIAHKPKGKMLCTDHEWKYHGTCTYVVKVSYEYTKRAYIYSPVEWRRDVHMMHNFNNTFL